MKKQLIKTKDYLNLTLEQKKEIVKKQYTGFQCQFCKYYEVNEKENFAGCKKFHWENNQTNINQNDEAGLLSWELLSEWITTNENWENCQDYELLTKKLYNDMIIKKMEWNKSKKLMDEKKITLNDFLKLNNDYPVKIHVLWSESKFFKDGDDKPNKIGETFNSITEFQARVNEAAEAEENDGGYSKTKFYIPLLGYTGRLDITHPSRESAKYNDLKTHILSYVNSHKKESIKRNEDVKEIDMYIEIIKTMA